MSCCGAPVSAILNGKGVSAFVYIVKINPGIRNLNCTCDVCIQLISADIDFRNDKPIAGTRFFFAIFGFFTFFAYGFGIFTVRLFGIFDLTHLRFLIFELTLRIQSILIHELETFLISLE